jgi:hypothetical protein
MMRFLFGQRKVPEMPKVSAILALLTICSVGVAAPPFEFDRQLAVAPQLAAQRERTSFSSDVKKMAFSWRSTLAQWTILKVTAATWDL